MAPETVIFYEKPGCAGNARQKEMLRQAGLRLEVRNLLAEPWTPEFLRPCFDDRPVPDWLNLSAPRVKTGEIDPQTLTEAEVLHLLIDEPVLIRRPLNQTPAGRKAGFEPHPLLLALGVELDAGRDLEGCSKSAPATPCPPP